MQTAGLIDEVRAVRARARALQARVPDDAAFAWRPKDGRAWSAGHCIDHLNQMHRVYFGEIRHALSRAERAPAPVTEPIRSTWIGRRFAASMEPGQVKMKSPPHVIPHVKFERAAVWDEFFRGLDELEATLNDAANIDLNRPTFPSPFFKLSRVRVGTGFRVLLAHLRRHLYQAEQALSQAEAALAR